MKYVSILGSTGSIGTQALKIIDMYPDDFKVVGLSCNKNINLFTSQIIKYKPEICAVMDKNTAIEIKNQFPHLKILSGINGLSEVATYHNAHIILTAISGMIGLKPTIDAITAGKTIALANKETLVAGGDIVMKHALKHNVNILPVDSEHSAIFQCLKNESSKTVNKIILTASGGPFRGKTITELSKITVAEALNHPNWNMGKKISIDSATLMNKGLEAIEAKYLFNLSMDQIEIVIHPESIVHSAVEYTDKSTIAQMSYPDMRIAIQYAFTYPERFPTHIRSISLWEIGKLTFEKPDMTTFKCLNLALEAIKIGKSMPAVMNCANEHAVRLFLSSKIAFTEISNLIENLMCLHTPFSLRDADDVESIASWVDKKINDLY